MAAAPGSPWGGGEGLMNRPWSGLLTRRMLAQGKNWSNARETKIGELLGKTEIRESRSDNREKIPGLVPALLGNVFKKSFLSLDARGLNGSTNLAKLGACLAYDQAGALRQPVKRRDAGFGGQTWWRPACCDESNRN